MKYSKNTSKKKRKLVVMKATKISGIMFLMAAMFLMFFFNSNMKTDSSSNYDLAHIIACNIANAEEITVIIPDCHKDAQEDCTANYQTVTGCDEGSPWWWEDDCTKKGTYVP